jgi:hypothetical protein
MSELVLKKKVVKVSYEGVDYLVAKPNAKQINDISKNDDKSIESVVMFLDSLGLPADIAWQLDPDSIQEIMEALMPKIPEKKS